MTFPHHLPSGHVGDRARQEFFEREIRPALGGTPRAHPTVVFIGGQPGVGKTTTQNQVVAHLGHRDAVSIDADDYVVGHPDYPALARHNDRDAAGKVAADASHWGGLAVNHAVQMRADIVISMPMGDHEWAANYARMFKNLGYRTEAIFIAGHESVSQLGVIDRYQKMRDTLTYGRWVGPEHHRACVTGCVRTAARLEHEGLVDAVSVRTRNGEELYRNSRDPQGQWTQPPMAAQALHDGQQRPWTAAEIADFRQKSTALADPRRRPETLAPDLQPLLRDTVAKGEAHISRHSGGGLSTRIQLAARWIRGYPAARRSATEAGRPQGQPGHGDVQRRQDQQHRQPGPREGSSR